MEAKLQNLTAEFKGSVDRQEYVKNNIEVQPCFALHFSLSFSSNFKKLNTPEQIELFQVFWTLSANLS